MAGKHQGIPDTGTPVIPSGTLRAQHPGDRQDRAYAEGRGTQKAGGLSGDNPHTAGTPEFNAWANGFAGGAFAQYQFQCAE